MDVCVCVCVCFILYNTKVGDAFHWPCTRYTRSERWGEPRRMYRPTSRRTRWPVGSITTQHICSQTAAVSRPDPDSNPKFWYITRRDCTLSSFVLFLVNLVLQFANCFIAIVPLQRCIRMRTVQQPSVALMYVANKIKCQNASPHPNTNSDLHNLT